MAPTAGWYEDPGGTGAMRWWNGTSWANETRPKPPDAGGHQQRWDGTGWTDPVRDSAVAEPASGGAHGADRPRPRRRGLLLGGAVVLGALLGGGAVAAWWSADNEVPAAVETDDGRSLTGDPDGSPDTEASGDPLGERVVIDPRFGLSVVGPPGDWQVDEDVDDRSRMIWLDSMQDESDGWVWTVNVSMGALGEGEEFAYPSYQQLLAGELELIDDDPDIELLRAPTAMEVSWADEAVTFTVHHTSGWQRQGLRADNVLETVSFARVDDIGVSIGVAQVDVASDRNPDRERAYRVLESVELDASTLASFSDEWRRRVDEWREG